MGTYNRCVKKLIKNSQPFGKNRQKTAGGGIFLTHTVHANRPAFDRILPLSRHITTNRV